MYRSFLLFLTAAALAVPASGSAQSSTAERDRERERQRIEREREQRERDAEQARERRARDLERARERAERDRERAQERAERERAGSLDTVVVFDAAGSLSVSCPGGAIIVTGTERNEIRVRARTENGAIRFSSNGSRAVLEPASGRGCSDGRFEVSVPFGAKVAASTFSGSVSVRAVRGSLDLHAQSGDVDVRDAGDRLDIETLSGDVVVSGVRGDANIHTISGEITLTSARGDLEVETVSGDLELRDVTAKQVRAHTTSGDITFTGQIIEAGRYEFGTHSGEIGLMLPGDIGAQLTLATFNGGIESDFPITLTPTSRTDTKRLNFTVGRGTARIVAETFSGDITLRRRR